MKIMFKYFSFFEKCFSVFYNFYRKCSPSSHFWENFFKSFHVFLEFNRIFNLFFFYKRIWVNTFKKKHCFHTIYLPIIRLSYIYLFTFYYRAPKIFFEKLWWGERGHINRYLKAINFTFASRTARSILYNLNTTFTIKKTRCVSNCFYTHRGINV